MLAAACMSLGNPLSMSGSGKRPRMFLGPDVPQAATRGEHLVLSLSRLENAAGISLK